MRLNTKQTLYRAILEDKWIDVFYVNAKEEKTHYFIGVKDIDMKEGRVYCDVFNSYKSHSVLTDGDKSIFIRLDGITQARIIDQSYYPSPEKLKKRLENEGDLFAYLEGDTLDNNILSYLSDCYKYDNDPYLRETVMLDGIDIKKFGTELKIKLTQEQFDLLLNTLYKKTFFEAERQNRYVDLAVNSFSIDIQGKQYVVAYRKLSLNFKTRTLHMEDHSTINQSFLLEEGTKVSLSAYLDMSPSDFIAEYGEHKRELIEQIKESFIHGELVNTRPTFFLIERRTQLGVDLAFEYITRCEKENTFTQPLKSFFGRNIGNTGSKKDPYIVVFDKKKVNIDQMRVVYNTMVNHVTYVQGPPGTGKTETIFNILLSAYANDKKVLVCSNNNHPIDDIMKRLLSSVERTNPRTGEKEAIRLPVLRLGNMAEMAKSIMRLKADLALAEKHKATNANEDSTNRSKEALVSSFTELRDLLAHFEQRIEITESIHKLEQFLPLGKTKAIQDEIQKQIDAFQEKLKAIPYVKNEDLGGHMISASEDKGFQNYVHYSALIRLKKLLSPTNADLRGIIEMDDASKTATELAKYLRDKKNLTKLLNIYPIILCTNLSCDKLGEPGPHFDLAIMDEAGQCNVATSLVPIVRAKDLVLVGDVNQLQPVTVIEPGIHDKLKSKYGVRDDYDYMHNSILSTMQRKDHNSKSIMLRYHYRCGQKIASFSNQRFYDGELKLESLAPGHLVYLNVANTHFNENRNSYIDEALTIADVIEKGNYKDVGIITPFVNQAHLINELLARKGIHNVTAGTIHTLQGSERSTIIMSAALSTRTAKKTMDWVKNNHELINVGVTRAKETLIFAGDKKAIDALSGNQANDIKALSDYVASQGTCVVPKIEGKAFSDFSNDSRSEKEFFETISPYFNGKKNALRIERNIPVKKAIKGISVVDYDKVGRKEFDVVVQAKTGLLGSRYRTIVAFEIDGGEHVGSKLTAERDRVKEEICKIYGIKLIRVANSQVKDYELIIALFERVLKGLPDIESVYKQGSIFDD